MRNSVTKKILLLLRDEVNRISKKEIPYPLHWCQPGGHVKVGETPFEALIREIEEEWSINLEKDRRINNLHLFAVLDLAIPERKSLQFIYVADVFEEFEPNDICLREGKKLEWFSEEDISVPDFPYAWDLHKMALMVLRKSE